MRSTQHLARLTLGRKPESFKPTNQEKRGHSFARYTDDFIILCRSPRAAQRIMASIAHFIEHRLKLIVNRTKSRVCEIAKSTFLGFTIVKNRIKCNAKSKKRFSERIREWERSGQRQPPGCPQGGAHKRHQITKRTRGVSPHTVMEDLQLFIRGAVNYYQLGMTYAEARDLDGWLRRRVRLYYWTPTVRSTGKPAKRKRRAVKPINSGDVPALEDAT